MHIIHKLDLNTQMAKFVLLKPSGLFLNKRFQEDTKVIVHKNLKSLNLFDLVCKIKVTISA